MWNSFSATRNVRSIRVLPALTGLMLLAWPFLIGFGLANNSLHGILPVMALVLLMRVCRARRQGGPLRYLFVSVALAGIALCAASYVLHAHQWVLLYPVVVNLVMLVVFGGSLWTAMPVVERLARLREPDLSPSGYVTRAGLPVSGAAFLLSTGRSRCLPYYTPISVCGRCGTG